jgi:group I intron endonuclease
LIKNLLNNNIYIGETNNPRRRWLQHKNTKTVDKYNTVIQRAILKYGSQNFSFDILETFITEIEAFEAEIWWIAYLKSLGAALYNLTEGGDGAGTYWLGKHLPQEMKNNISLGRKGKYGGENNPMYNKLHTTETKMKISKVNKKINNETVKEIRKLIETKLYTGKELAKIFNISTAQISRIKNKKQRNL